jgi:UDP-glucose 4-epimerase
VPFRAALWCNVKMRTILVTGGAGYIGSHTCVALLEADNEVVVIDDLSNSSAKSLDGIAAITGRRVEFHKVDLVDAAAVNEVMARYPIDSVVHFAGLKAVGESVAEPLRYWRRNLDATFSLLEAMAANGVYDLVFSSSATVYGQPERIPLDEDCAVRPTNPYGHTKLTIEQVLRDICASDERWRVALLRYFNPVGAHPSGLIGEDPRGIPNNLMPYLMKVAVGELPELPVYGNDYDTPDGTGVRDYIHVVDLAAGHLAALDRLRSTPGCFTYNLGTGKGTSVMELIAAAEHAAGRTIPYRLETRRSGDVATVFADPSRANRELGWRADSSIDKMVADHWNWQHNHPKGYEE